MLLVLVYRASAQAGTYEIPTDQIDHDLDHLDANLPP